jgi:hypothetical protein
MMKWKEDECSCDIIKVLSQHLPEENHAKPTRMVGVSLLRIELSTS